MALEWQSDKMASDIEVHMKEMFVIEFFHAEKMASADIHQCLQNIDGD